MWVGLCDFGAMGNTMAPESASVKRHRHVADRRQDYEKEEIALQNQIPARQRRKLRSAPVTVPQAEGDGEKPAKKDIVVEVSKTVAAVAPSPVPKTSALTDKALAFIDNWVDRLDRSSWRDPQELAICGETR